VLEVALELELVSLDQELDMVSDQEEFLLQE
jgi:hypothetical protein